MKELRLFTICLLGFSLSIFAADFSMQQSIVFSVPPFQQMGNVLGPAPEFHAPAIGKTSYCRNTYDICTNGRNKKIIAFLDANMPENTQLDVYLAPPCGARTMGFKTLSVTPVDLVIEISCISETGLALVYNFQVKPGVSIIENDTRIVTFTMTDG